MSVFFSKVYNAYLAIPNLNLEAYSLDNIRSYALDLKMQRFLENYYSVDLSNKEECAQYLALWQYEALLSIVRYSKEKSLFYKDLELGEEVLFQEEAKKWTREELKLKTQKYIQTLPFTQASDILSKNMSFLAIGQDEVDGIVSIETSGTSIDSKAVNAKKKQIYSSHKDFESTIQFFFFGMQYLLRSKEDRVALLMSGERIGSIGQLFAIAMQRLHIECKVIGFSTDYAQISQDLIDFRASCVVAISWHMLKISSYIKEEKLTHSIKKVLLSGDTASKALKNELSKNLSCEVFDHYGITEFGFAGAVECMEHKALHLRELDLYIEIIDKDLNKVKNDVFGEIVVTTLTREAMPLIRYRTGDRGRIISKKCSCGSLLTCIEVEGRIMQGVQINSDLFLHISNFQDFFFNYKNFTCSDFNICLYEDSKKEEDVLLIGVDFSQETENLREDLRKKLNECQIDFIKHFNLDLKAYTLKVDEKAKKGKEKKEVAHIYLCTMTLFNNIILESEREGDKVAMLNSTSNNENLDSFLRTSKAKTQKSLISAKKKIHHKKGDLVEAIKAYHIF